MTERKTLAVTTKPPFDGSEPCVFCPMELRSLMAEIHNALGSFERAVEGQEDWSRTRRKMAELRQGYESLQPLVDAHFADSMHSHGRVNQ